MLTQPEDFTIEVNEPSDEETFRFSDGSWWTIRTLVTRGMRKAIRKSAMKNLPKIDPNEDIDFEDKEALKRRMFQDLESFDVDADDDAYLIHGTVAWSWDSAVSVDFLDTLPDPQTEVVLVRMQELYVPLSEAEAKKDSKTP